jgi:5S rRNA maturation endonuclease (ribonuclease M5)
MHHHCHNKLVGCRHNKKRRTQQDVILVDMVEQGNALLNELRQASEDRKAAAVDRRLGLSLLQKENKFHARLEVAKALGNTEELKKLMEEARSME